MPKAKTPAKSKTKKDDFKIPEKELDDLLHKYCNDFTALEREGVYDPITGRDEEIDNMILILLQRNRKNVCLLAPAGVGKTALVVGLAQAVVAGRVPAYLKDARVLELDLAAMAAGTSGPGEFQERFIPICKGIAERYGKPGSPQTILFIDEIHTIMPTVTGSAYAGLSEVMKPYLTVGNLLVVGATTRDEYRMFVAQDPAMDRRFQKVHLKVPTSEETFVILQAIKGKYEQHHGITISDDCLQEIVKLTDRHMKKRNQPDKSIITMDAAAAWHVMFNGTGGELSMEAVYRLVAKETGLHPGALSEKLLHAEKKIYDPENKSKEN